MNRFEAMTPEQYFFHSLDVRDRLLDAERVTMRFTDGYVAPEPEADEDAPATSNGERVAKTWADPSIAAKRNTRDGVRVTVAGASTMHKSTFAAFTAYSLPEKFHVKFRAELKRDKEKVFLWESVPYKFEIVPLSDITP